MEYEIKHYYRVKYAIVCVRQSFLKEPPKDDYEEYARKVIDRAYFSILNIQHFVLIPYRLRRVKCSLCERGQILW